MAKKWVKKPHFSVKTYIHVVFFSEPNENSVGSVMTETTLR